MQKLFEFDEHIGAWRVLVQTRDIQSGAVSTRCLADEAVTEDKLADGSVTGVKIGTGAVTEDKIADGAIDSIHIKSNTVSGEKLADEAIESRHIKDNSIGAEKIKDGTIENVDIKDGTLDGSKIKDGTIEGTKMADNAIESRHLIDNSIPGSKIKDGTIENVDIKDGTLDGSKIKDNTIQGGKLADGAISNSKIVDGSVTESKIGTGAVTESKVGTGAVTENKIGTGAVTENKISDGAVTENKLAPGAVTTDKLSDGVISELQTITDAVPTASSVKPVQSGGTLDSIIKHGSAFDLSAYNSGTTYADLTAALTALNSLPSTFKKGGMSFKYVQTSDNKYVQARLMAQNFTTDTTQWQGVDDEPTAGSDNLVKSGGVAHILMANVSFTEMGYYSNGILTYDANANATDKLVILGKRIKYRLRLNRYGQIISFFDENKNFLSSISVTIDSQSLAIREGEIDLTDPTYVNAKYVAFSCYLYDETFYAYIDGYNVAEEIIRNRQSIKQINDKLILNGSFTDTGFYANGVLTYDANAKSTDKLFIFGNKIKWRLRLNRTGQVVTFFNENKEFISSISITIDTQEAEIREGEIDLTNSNYSNARYVAFSCYAYNDTFYALIEGSNIAEEIENLHKEIQNKPLPFLYGKKFCALGDSITDGVGNDSYSWYDMLLDRYNAVTGSLNFAETGQCLRTMADLCTLDNMNDIDICFVSGGTNQLSNYRLGTINDDATPDRWQPNKAYNVGDKVLGGTMERHGWITNIMAYLYWYECVTAGTSGNTEDASGFNTTTDSITQDGTVEWKCIGNPSWYSDLKGICRKVWSLNPKIQIIWIVPIKTRYDANINVPSQWRNAQKFQAIRDFCDSYSIRMIDLQKEFPLNEWTKYSIMADDLHPNNNGYKIIQDIICSHIE